ncbi:MAG: peptidase M19 [Alphaproteobacteria bacterium]|nr:peptidase M19 [Alphaproteobacteria bacterium]
MEAGFANTGDHWTVSEQARRLHRSAVICDMLLPFMYGANEPKYQTLERMAASGTSFVSLTVAVDWHSLEYTLHAIARERAWFRAHADKYVLVETVDDILKAKREGKLAVAFHFQGTNPLQADADMIEPYYRLGVKHMLMAYNQKNAVGDGCYEAVDGGLSKFGRMVVREMNRVGMLVDLSHTGYRTCRDVFEVSSAPVCFTHSNPLALWDNPRNIGDDLILATAKSGGIVGVNGIGLHMGDNDASTEMICRQIDHISGLVGAQHVGLGLDYVYDNVALMVDFATHPAWNPDGAIGAKATRGYEPKDVAFAAPEQLPELTEMLLKRSYSEADIRGILGENWLRVLRRVWK